MQTEDLSPGTADEEILLFQIPLEMGQNVTLESPAPPGYRLVNATPSVLPAPRGPLDTGPPRMAVVLVMVFTRPKTGSANGVDIRN